MRAMAAEWAALGAPSEGPTGIESWRDAYSQMRDQEEDLRSTGRWVSGPSDLLRVARVVDDELVHSNVVAWLLDPTARHGLGDQVLGRILAAGWPYAEQPVSSRARVDR